ncbi:hypothetical protein [Actinomadura sp. WMMA1423]|uniref:hypothetical protein n=1 Tax=Actinomadura sp. WMMA1423 TaxID=2591108 RepID=UPI00197AC8B8|nr:hypothetical protein [Actinomadura sp. WMMA1423]
MKNRPRDNQHPPQSSAHSPAPTAPMFQSPETGPAVAALLADKRNAVVHHGQQAQARRQDAEEHLRQVAAREEMIAEREREIAEFRAAKEREIASLREEIGRYDTAAKDATSDAGSHTQAQRDAELAAHDLERVLRTHAPAALELAAPANSTPPGGTPSQGTPAAVNAGPGVLVAGNGTGPQPLAGPARTPEGR